jgi:hypothetical protein
MLEQIIDEENKASLATDCCKTDESIKDDNSEDSKIDFNIPEIGEKPDDSGYS